MERARDSLLFGVEVNSDDEAVQTQYFSEDKNKDHADEESRLLCCATYTGVTHNADGETCRKTGEPDGQARAQVDETSAKLFIVF